jgi:hypothetical protein
MSDRGARYPYLRGLEESVGSSRALSRMAKVVLAIIVALTAGAAVYLLQ